ncbi:hypothetical protein LJR289_000281 [Pseudoduganella sp. LjRoot289]|uniref:hypothetical protein n=1 Tax=Pseudoduganella sp. LjRoot289 TaxID=3342314 RepID=UPI003ECE21F7
MPTLTIQIPDNLHSELMDAVEQRDIPLQEFLTIAITEEIDREKNRQEVERRYEEYLRTGIAYTLDEVEEHMEKYVAERSEQSKKTQAG